MENFKQDLLDAVGNDTIECIIIIDGEIYRDPRRTIPVELTRKPLAPEIALQFLDYNYDPGFGGVDCHDVLVYTADRVLYIHEYDGSTEFRSVPRNPTSW